MRYQLLVGAILLTSSPIAAHSWYGGLMDPYGQNCCENRDCHRVEMCRTKRGDPGVEIGPVCVEIPWNRVLEISSPDGQAHACWSHVRGEPAPIVRCVILPGES